MFSADPNLIESAKLIDEVSYDEMLEAATAGAKVLHNRAVSLAKKYKLKVKVKNTRGEKEGTSVVDSKDVINENYKTRILAIEKELAKITIVGEHMYSNAEYIAKIYTLAKENNIVIYMLAFSEISLNIIVKEKEANEFAKKIQELLDT